MTDMTPRHDLRVNGTRSESLMPKLLHSRKSQGAGKAAHTRERWTEFTRKDGMLVRCLLKGHELYHVVIKTPRGSAVDIAPEQIDLNMIEKGLKFRPTVSFPRARKTVARRSREIRLATG